MVVVLLDLAAAADDDTATTGLKGFTHPGIAVDDPARGEVRSLDIVDQPSGIDIPLVVDVCHAGIDGLGEVVRCHIRSHPDSDTS